MNYSMTNMHPTKILVNGKQILPGRTLNMEYHHKPETINGGSFLSKIPILGPLVDNILGTGLYNSNYVGGIHGNGVGYDPSIPQGWPTTMYGNTPYNYGVYNTTQLPYRGQELAGSGMMNMYTEKKYSPITSEAYPVMGSGMSPVSYTNLPYRADYNNMSGSAIHGGWIQYIPAVLSAVDLLGSLFKSKGGALNDYNKYIDESPKEMDIEFQHPVDGTLHKTRARLNRLGMHLLHKPEVVADILSKGKMMGSGIRGNYGYGIRGMPYSTYGSGGTYLPVPDIHGIRGGMMRYDNAYNGPSDTLYNNVNVA